MRLRFHACALIVLALATRSTFAADATDERYAILSLIGDALTIVTYQPATGSNVNTNLRQIVPLGDELNRVAETEAERVIRRVVPGVKTITLTLSDPDLTGRNEEIADSPARVKALADPIAAQLGAGTHWMVLVTKHHGDMRLRVADGVLGAGTLTGLGFYIDRLMHMQRTDTGEAGRGFLAPYAYVSVSLVDLTTGAIVRTRNSDESYAVPMTRSPTSMDPWQALSAEEKMQSLQRMIRRAIDVNVPLLLAPT